jgi:hypothetical protein
VVTDDGGECEDHGGERGEEPEQTERPPQLGFSHVILLPELTQIRAVLSGLELQKVLHVGKGTAGAHSHSESGEKSLKLFKKLFPNQSILELFWQVLNFKMFFMLVREQLARTVIQKAVGNNVDSHKLF